MSRRPEPISRRELLRLGGMLAGLAATGSLIAACSSAAPPAAAPGAAPAAKANRPLKLDFAHFVNNTEPSVGAFRDMAAEITKRTNGDINVTYHPASLLNKEIDIVNAVKAGSVAFGPTGGAAGSVFPETEILSVPYLFRDYEHAYKVLNGDIGNQLVKTIETKYGVKFVLWHDFGFRNFLTTKKPIKTPDDMKGMKMRVMQGSMYADAVNSFGGAAVPMAWNETVTAAQQGVIDGLDLPIINIEVTKAWEYAKYVTTNMYSFGPSVLIMNQGVWQGLTAAEQKVIMDLAKDTSARTRREYEEGDKRVLTTLSGKGMEVVNSDNEAFRKVAMEKVWPKYKQSSGDLIDRIQAVK